MGRLAKPVKAEAGRGVMGSLMSRSSSEEGLDEDEEEDSSESKLRFLSLVGYVKVVVIVVLW